MTPKLICDTNFYYNPWNEALEECNLKPTPTLGNCGELLLHQKSSENNRSARNELKIYIDQLINELPYDRIRNFFRIHNLSCSVPQIDNDRIVDIFRNQLDYSFDPVALRKVKKEHLRSLEVNGSTVRQLLKNYDTRGKSEEVINYDATMLFFYLYLKEDVLSQEIYLAFISNFKIFVSVWCSKLRSMITNPREKLKPNDFYDIMQFLYLNEGDYCITGEKRIQGYVNQTNSIELLTGPHNLTLYQVRG
ncbi:hypothetical protein [Owenweeksia hongkongensis]|uniref:hypothetical protein n=1 Tax=Owenweeksia hongkongensis TaxID=253245 RepID=UPI003A9060AD